MKKLLLLGALTAITLFQAAQPSEAYFRGKWCAKTDSGGGVVGERCDFPTFETCRSYVNAYPKSWCVQNQWRAENWGIIGDRVLGGVIHDTNLHRYALSSGHRTGIFVDCNACGESRDDTSFPLRHTRPGGTDGVHTIGFDRGQANQA